MPTVSARPARATPFQRRAAIAASIALLGWLVYLNALTNPFVFDDYRLVVENESLRPPFRIGAIVWRDMSRPLVNLSYAVDLRVWGDAPLGFHVTNVLLHFVNIVLVFACAWSVAIDREGRREAGATIVAIVAATLFAVHPLMSQAVGYVSARSELLCGMFLLTSFLCARQFMASGRWMWFVALFAAWSGSLASKEAGAMLPFLLIAYAYIVLPSGTRTQGRLWRTVFAPLLVVTAIAAAARILLLLRIEYASAGPDAELTLVALDAFRKYLALIVYPSGQTIFHVLPLTTTLFSTRGILVVGVVAAAAAAAWWSRRVDRLISFGFLWFVLLLLPSSVLFLLGRGEALAEHRSYLAAIGLFLAAGALADYTLSQAGHRRAVRFAVYSTGALIAAFLISRTIERNRVWSSALSLWSEAVTREPRHWFPRLMLGETLRLERGCEAAVPEFRRALESSPSEPLPYEKLGGCLVELRRFAEAGQTYTALSSVAPRSAAGPIGLGVVAMLQHGPDQSRGHLQEAVAREPGSVAARRLLATLEEPERPAEALRLCREIQALAPATPGNEDCIRRSEEKIGKK